MKACRDGGTLCQPSRAGGVAVGRVLGGRHYASRVRAGLRTATCRSHRWKCACADSTDAHGHGISHARQRGRATLIGGRQKPHSIHARSA